MNQNQVQRFVVFLEEKGYCTQTIHRYSKALEQVPETWNTSSPEELYEHITKMLIILKNSTESPAYYRELKPASSQFFLMMTGITFKLYMKQIKNPSRYEILLDEFYHYSTEFKAMTTLSAQAEQSHVRSFLDTLNVKPADIVNLQATDLRDYIRYSLFELKPSSKGRYVTSLRNFFRFLEYKGLKINPAIFKLPLTPAEWNKSKTPVILTEDEENRLRVHYSGNTEKDKRNQIILLLMLDLGLRCTEVSRLKLSDFRWYNGTIVINETKTKHARELPIPEKLGHLIEDYIMNFRSHTQDNHLLQRKILNKEHEAMSRESVRSVMRYTFSKEEIVGWWKGTHTLRRTAASRIYNAGNDLKLTADLLGHESLYTTTQYVKVNFETLRKAAAPWPGGSYEAE